MKAKTRRQNECCLVWPQLGTYASGNSNFLSLCICPWMTMKVVLTLELQINFSWVGEFANTDSLNNKDQLYTYIFMYYFNESVLIQNHRLYAIEIVTHFILVNISCYLYFCWFFFHLDTAALFGKEWIMNQIISFSITF